MVRATDSKPVRSGFDSHLAHQIKDNMQVMHDRVLIRKLEQSNKTDSGLFLAGTQDKVYEADVVAVGTGKPVKDCNPIPLTVTVGDRVIYNPNATIAVNVKGENLLVIKEEEIFAILDKDE
jgi:chaperonin GroES